MSLYLDTSCLLKVLFPEHLGFSVLLPR